MVLDEVVEWVDGEVERLLEPKRPVRRDSVGAEGEVSWREWRAGEVDDEAAVVVSWWKRGILLPKVRT